MTTNTPIAIRFDELLPPQLAGQDPPPKPVQQFSLCATIIVRFPGGSTDVLHVNVKDDTLTDAHEKLAKAIRTAQRQHSKDTHD